MKQRCHVLFWVITLSLFWVIPASGSPFREKLPQLVRLTGTFSPTSVKDSDTPPYLLEISIDGNSRPFYVHEAKSLTSDDRSSQILRDLGTLLVLIGPTPLLDQLTSADALLTPLQLEGRLYIGTRTFALSSVSVAPSSGQ